MDKVQLYVKTDKALEEIRSKKYKVKPKLRNLLFLIDGSKSVETITEISGQLGMNAEELASLESDGFIARVDGGEAEGAAHPLMAEEEPAPTDEAGKFRVAKKYMNDTVVNVLGFRAFMFTLKLEKAGTRLDLLDLINEYGNSITKATNPETAKVLARRANELLA